MSLTKYVLPEEVTIIVRRESILEDSIRSVKRSSFRCDHTVVVSGRYVLLCSLVSIRFCRTVQTTLLWTQVEFLGEPGEDGGGLKREFWCLLSKEIRNYMFEGRGQRMVPRHDAVALQVS